MMKCLRILLACAIALMPLADASAATVNIGVKDGGGTSRNFIVTTNTDLTGNLSWNNVICDQSAGTTCASVGTAGSPSTNALTVQPVTLGNGTSANAARVTISSDSTGTVAVTNTGTFAAQATLSAETTKVIGTVRSLGNAGAIFDGATGAAVPANVLYMGINNGGNLAGWTGAVTNAGTFAVQLSGATNNINNISGTISLPTSAATSTKQSDGSQKTQIVDGSGNVIASTSNNLNVQCANCSGSGASAADAATFTAGTSVMAPGGGEFTSGGATACVTGHQCMVGMTAARAFLTDTSSMGGTAIASGCTAALNGFSTSIPATVCSVMGTYILNSNANGSATSANSSPVVIASDQAAVAVKAASGAIASGAVVDITNMSVATGSAPPTKAIYLGGNASGATGGQVAGLVTCDSHVFKHITSATDTLAVQGVASQSIRICGWRSRAAGTATWFLENTASTNANCSSANTQITGVASEVANSGETMLASFWTGLKNTSGNGLCINSTGTGGVDIDIWYNQF